MNHPYHIQFIFFKILSHLLIFTSISILLFFHFASLKIFLIDHSLFFLENLIIMLILKVNRSELTLCYKLVFLNLLNDLFCLFHIFFYSVLNLASNNFFLYYYLIFLIFKEKKHCVICCFDFSIFYVKNWFMLIRMVVDVFDMKYNYLWEYKSVLAIVK